ncbi:MAG: flavin reductase family protein [Acetobacter sp.]|nr:flavin reductase family protein [Acetobacter sp.]
MTKQTWKPGTMLSPLPPALISSGDMEHPNVMTAAWTGIICSDPVITYVSLRPSRYTHELVSKNKEFVINLPTWKDAEAVDMVGVKSGRDLDKFALTGFVAESSTQVKAPQIMQCPVSIECKVLEVRSFGTHDMFLAEVVAVNVDEQYIDDTGALDLERAGLLAYAHGFYYTLGRKIGKFGFSVEKKKKQPAAPQVSTIIKADKKFATALKVRTVEETTMENGVEVVTRKPKFKKPERKPASRFEERDAYGERRGRGERREFSSDRRREGGFARKQREDGERREFSRDRREYGEKKEFSRERREDMRGERKPAGRKFADKRAKSTSYEGKPYKKRPDGSFKRGAPRRND